MAELLLGEVALIDFRRKAGGGSVAAVMAGRSGALPESRSHSVCVASLTVGLKVSTMQVVRVI